MKKHGYKRKQVRKPNRDVEAIEDREGGLTKSLMRQERRLEGLDWERWGLSHRWDDGREF